MTAPAHFQLRVATRRDVDAIARLIDRSVRALSAGIYSAEQVESGLRHLFGVDTTLVDGGTYFVIEHEKQIVAAGGWSRWRTLFGGDQYKGETDPPLDPASEPARIRAFFVHPEWARRGLGRMLFEACEDAARAANFSSLQLMATLPGVPLYRALGFVEVAPVELGLPDGVVMNLVRMGRRLDD